MEKLSFFKNTVFFILFLMISSPSVIAESYVMRSYVAQISSLENPNELTYTEWTNSGQAFDCGQWLPLESTVESGVTFVQSRDCSQHQLRSVTTREYDSVSESYLVIGTTQEQRTIQETEIQNNTGTAWPATYACTFKIGLANANATCNNNILSGTVGASTLIGTCSNGNYVTSSPVVKSGACQ